MKFELTEKQIKQVEILKRENHHLYGWTGQIEYRFRTTEIGYGVIVVFHTRTKKGKFRKKKFDITDYDSW